MRIKPGPAANTKRVVTLMRQANTAANEKYGIGGREKQRKRPPITLPKLKCLEDRK